MAALFPDNENLPPRHKKGRSSFTRLNMAVVLENLGDLCAISPRNAATRDQLIARLRNNCVYWKANDRDAKILVDQFLTIGRKQNLCYPVVGRSQTWKIGPPPPERRMIRRETTFHRDNSNIINNFDGNLVSSMKNSPCRNPKSALSVDTRANTPLFNALEQHHEDSQQQPSTPPSSPVRLTNADQYPSVEPPIRREEELSLPALEESAPAPPKCQGCGGQCDRSLVELCKKAQNFSYDLACFKLMFEQILVRRKLLAERATADQSKSRNICVECNCKTSRPPPGCRTRKNYSLDELLNMLAELNRRRILAKMADRKRSRANDRDRYHKSHHHQQFILTPRAIIPITRQAKIELAQSPAEVKHCSKKLKEKSRTKKRRQKVVETENSLKTAKSSMKSPKDGVSGKSHV